MKRILRFLSVHEMLSLDANSRLADSSSATPVLKLVCPSLVRLDCRMRIRPAVADRFEASPDRRTFRFHIRPGQSFHSGRSVTAKSVVENFARIFDNRFGSILAQDYSGLENLAAPDAETVEFAFKDPFPAFLHHLAGRTHITEDTQMQPSGAGAFRVSDWIRGDFLRLERFSAYNGPDPAQADEVIVRWAPDGKVRLAMIEAGEADLVEAVPAKAAAALAERDILHSRAAPDTMRKLSFCFNLAKPPFDEPRVRLAAAMAIDRQAIIDVYLAPHADIFDSAYPEDSPYGVSLKPIPRDTAEAKRLVEECGAYGMTIRTIATNVAPVQGVAEMVASQLREIGLHLDIRYYNDPPWWPLIYLDTDWQAAFQGMGPRAHPDILFRREYSTGGTFNPSGYSNPDLDRLIDQARTTLDEAEQARLYREAQVIIRRDLPYLPLYRNVSPVGWAPGVEGFEPHPLGYWELAPARMKSWAA